jgi:hypothetical protein
MQTDNRRKRTWYERVFDNTHLTTPRSALDPYLNFNKHPNWVTNVMRELANQNMPAISIKKMHPITPEKAGTFLGQHCANVYAVAENFQVGMHSVRKLDEAVGPLQQSRAKPGASSLLSMVKALGLLIKDSPKRGRQFKIIALQAFKKALGQPNHQEAAEFFQGFGNGISMKGLTSSGAARRTTATPVYIKMFLNWQEVDRLPSVPKLRVFLLTHGLSENQVGDISRLRRLCSRVGYAPGKRGRPRKSKK